MKVSEAVSALNLEYVAGRDAEDREISGCYIGDLLSWVMGRALEGNVWITIMSNINIVAVASLTDAACILLAENVVPDEDVIKKAEMQDVIILKSDKTAYVLATGLYELMK